MKIKRTGIAIAGAAALAAVAIGIPAASAAPTAAAAPPPATTADLSVWLGLGQGGAAAGSTYYPLEFSNISDHTVTIRGFPGVSAFDGNGDQLGSPANWDHVSPVVTITLATGTTAHTTLRIANAGNFDGVRTATASGLKIYPPNQTTSTTIGYSFQALAEEGPIYLSVVGPIQPGTGIPGQL